MGWHLVTDVSMLEAGSQVVIATNAKGFVASAIANVELPNGAAPDAHRDAAEHWLHAVDKGRAYAVGMASNHTLWLSDGTWKYIQPSNGPAMVPWGPKIETGYNVNPQLYKMSGDDANVCEVENLAHSNPETVRQMEAFLNELRKKPQQQETVSK